MKDHDGHMVHSAGLYIDLEHPIIGASPDGVIKCSVCGDGVLEVKCPHCFREGLPEEETKSFCMEKNDNGQWILKKDHTYYYQVQTQLKVCDTRYCDFVVWTEQNVVVERIEADKDFFQNTIDNVEHFFKYGILPEIIGRWYTRKPVADASGVVTGMSTLPTDPQTADNEDYVRSWCYCNQPSYGNMIGCDNEACTIEWFHYDCLRIRCPPKGKWYCPSCKKLAQFSRKRVKH